MIRVLIADDSPTARTLLTEVLTSDPGITVVGAAQNGQEAVSLVDRLRPDLVMLDVHMPVLGGLAATRQIMERHPTPIVMISGHAANDEIDLSLDAIRLGALTLVSKPESPLAPDFTRQARDLLAMVKAMAAVKVVRRWPDAPRETALPLPTPALPRRSGVRAIALAASTGGPAALRRILRGLPGNFPAPILVVQHIAAGFTAGLAQWLNEQTALTVRVGTTGEVVRGGTVYLAPDGRHLEVDPGGRLALIAAPPLLGCLPSATHLFATAARAYGAGLVAGILTGMGTDGVAGLPEVKALGGRIIAQDEATSVVFGMPRQAIVAGLPDIVLGIDAIPRYLIDLLSGVPDVAQYSGR